MCLPTYAGVPDDARTYIAYLVGFAALIAAVGGIAPIIYKMKKRRTLMELAPI